MKMRISIEFTTEQLLNIEAYYGLYFPAHRVLLEDLVRAYGDPTVGKHWQTIFKDGEQEYNGLQALRARGKERLQHERALISDAKKGAANAEN
jgi:hypothetical protein